MSTEDGSTIVGIANNSPAQKAGILFGDRLVTIDGAPCDNNYRSNVLRLVGDAGSVVRIVVRRSEANLDFALARE